MNVKNINEAFKRIYEDTTPELTADTDLRTALVAEVDRLMAEGGYIKQFEIAFQDVIEKFYPDKAWWEVCSINIFEHLFTVRDPMETVDAIVADIEGAPVAEESLQESPTIKECPVCGRNFAESECAKTENGCACPKCGEELIKVDSGEYVKYEESVEKPTDKTAVNEMYALKHAMMEALSRLTEAEMSDEDRADSELIRSAIRKIQKRSNAAFTPQEQAVLAKYGITRNNYMKNLFVGDRPLSRRVDDKRHSSYYGRSFNNGDPSKINYADRARKLPQRADSQIYGSGYYTNNNDDLNAHGSYGPAANLQDAHRHSLDIPNEEKMRQMRDALRDRRYHQDRIDNADAARAKRMAAAQQAFDKAKRDADWWYTQDTESSSRSRDRAQNTIDTLLKRKKTEEGLQEALHDTDEIALELQTALDAEGLVLNPAEGTVEDAAEYIALSRDIMGEYSVEDWIRDTKQNYPEYFNK